MRRRRALLIAVVRQGGRVALTSRFAAGPVTGFGARATDARNIVFVKQ
jgi:hypothetical protein